MKVPMEKQTNDSHISFYLDTPTLRAIEAAAGSEERSRSDWIRLVLRQHLRERGLSPPAGTMAARPARRRERVS